MQLAGNVIFISYQNISGGSLASSLAASLSYFSMEPVLEYLILPPFCSNRVRSVLFSGSALVGLMSKYENHSSSPSAPSGILVMSADFFTFTWST